MTKNFRSIFFYRTKQANPLEEEEQAPAVAGAGQYRDLEGGSGASKNGGEKPGSGGARRDDDTLCFVAYLVTCVGIYYMLLGRFYLPPEAGADGGGVVAIVGGVFLAITGPVLVALCCCSRRHARGSITASAVEG